MSEIHAKFTTDLGSFRLDADFRAPAHGVTALFGKSGSGKTTVLRCITGLERATDGYFGIPSEVWQDEGNGIFVPTHRRSVGYVMQEPSLFPHLNVRENLEFGWRRIPPSQRLISKEFASSLLGLDPLLHRGTDHLSGGERQRVAIAQALLTSPRLLLLDEPVSALDRHGRAEVLRFLEKLRAELSIPIFYVSHSLEEIIRLSEHLVMMEEGRVRSAGPLVELFGSLESCLDLGDEGGVIVEASVTEHDLKYQLTTLSFGTGSVNIPKVPNVIIPIDLRVRLRIRARDVSLAQSPELLDNAPGVASGCITEILEKNEALVLVRVDCGGVPLISEVTSRLRHERGLKVGQRISARIQNFNYFLPFIEST